MVDEDDIQDPLEDEHQLARVKNWIISHRLSPFRLSDVLSSFTDISTGFAEEIMNKLVEEGVISKTGKDIYNINNQKISEYDFPDVKEEMDCQAIPPGGKAPSVYDNMHMKALYHAHPMNYVSAGKLQGKLNGAANPITVWKLIERMVYDGLLESKGSRRLGKRVLHSDLTEKKLAEAKRVLEPEDKDVNQPQEKSSTPNLNQKGGSNQPDMSTCGGLHSIGSSASQSNQSFSKIRENESTPISRAKKPITAADNTGSSGDDVEPMDRANFITQQLGPSTFSGPVDLFCYEDQTSIKDLINETSDPESERSPSKKRRKKTLFKSISTRSKEALDAENDLSVPDHIIKDLYSFYKEAEGQLQDVIVSQSYITQRMSLIDALVGVHAEFKLHPESLFLGISTMDRFLFKKFVPENKLELVSISSMILASKYEEAQQKNIVYRFLKRLGKESEKERLLSMEKDILNCIKWDMTIPTPYMFIVREVSTNKKMKNLVMFLTELAVMEYKIIVGYPSSVIAAAAVFVARCTLKEQHPFWPQNLMELTGCSEQVITECAEKLARVHQTVSTPGQIWQVMKKYYGADRYEVARIQLAEVNTFNDS